jgi:hypothetical protein
MFTASFLFASLVWGSIGIGYFIYGKKQQSLSAMLGGILMVAVSYFVSSALFMSLICVGVIVVVYQLVRREY